MMPSQRQDVETSPRCVHGYPSLAAFIASDKDQLTSIYPSFHRLSTRNLLYLEAELAELQGRLDRFDLEDLYGSFEAKEYARSWVRLAGSDHPGHQERVQLIRDIREKVKEYQEALLLEQRILQIPKPHQRTIDAFRSWFNGQHRGPEHEGPLLDDLSAHRLDDPRDLVVLSEPPGQDLLIRFVRRYLKVFFIESEIEGPLLVRISERKIARAAAILSTILAAILLIGAVVSLSFASNNKLRLGLIGAYTTVFAVTVGVLTNARQAELFGSTAAYAAVLVIFVGSPLMPDIGASETESPSPRIAEDVRRALAGYNSVTQTERGR